MNASTSRTLGLPVAVAVLMVGVVFAANGGRYGAAGVALGVLAAIAGGAAAVGLFRSARPRRTDRVDGRRRGSSNGLPGGSGT